jgi:membrane-bound serine protease (ClpP class)
VRQSGRRSQIAVAPGSAHWSRRRIGRRPIRLLVAALAAAWLALAPAVHGAGPQVVVLTATGVVDNVMAGYLSDGVAGAAQSGAAAVVIELDTPGGSLDSMRTIVTALQESTIPTIVWVAPAGARAASAGTFITLAANLIYMAPSTEIGAASPVDQSGNDITGTEGQKVKNDAIAYITSIAEARGRPVDWAVSTVDQAASSSASQAVALHVADGIAATLDDVLAAANGKTVSVRGGDSVTIDVAGADVVQEGLNPFQAFIHLLSDPNIAFILFTIGFYGLLFEVIHPNFITGTVGALSIILGLIGFGSLPLNVGGLLLIVLGLALLVLELHVVSHGLLTVAGVACFVLGASALYSAPTSPSEGDFSVALPLIATMTVTSLLFAGVALGTVLRYRRRLALRPVPYGAGSGPLVPVGTTGEVRSPLRPSGTVYAAGEEWSARAVDEAAGTTITSGGVAVPRGAPVTVVGQEGLTLIVRPDGAAGPVA